MQATSRESFIFTWSGKKVWIMRANMNKSWKRHKNPLPFPCERCTDAERWSSADVSGWGRFTPIYSLPEQWPGKAMSAVGEMPITFTFFSSSPARKTLAALPFRHPIIPFWLETHNQIWSLIDGFYQVTPFKGFVALEVFFKPTHMGCN